MPRLNRHCTAKASLSELGRSMLLADVAIDYTHDKGCRQTYDSPSETELGSLENVTVTRISGADWEITRKTRPDWMAFADACVGNKLESENVLRFIGHEC